MNAVVTLNRLELGAVMRVTLLHQDTETFSVEWLPRTDRVVVHVADKLYEITEEGGAEEISNADLAVPPEAVA